MPTSADLAKNNASKGGDTLPPVGGGSVHSFPITWYYPPVIAEDLDGVELETRFKPEVLACSWEYARAVIPQYTNWDRYVAFMRIIVVAIVAEFRGELVDVAGSDNVLGYRLDDVLDTLFAGTPWRESMARELRTFFLVTADKAGGRRRRNGELFRRYVNALVLSPRHWFRLRDCDGLARFTIAAALACNDLDQVCFTDDELEVLGEIGCTLYDSVAFFKHRTEGETNSTFAYAPEEDRVAAFARCREILWALDLAWTHRPGGFVVVNFIRAFGGPIQTAMRRYRFVEDGLTVGSPETPQAVDQTRRNFKLWNRVDANHPDPGADGTFAAQQRRRYRDLITTRSSDLMFPGFAGYLEAADEGNCQHCIYRDSYGAETVGRFGGVHLCADCRTAWGVYLEALPQRAAAVFPEILSAKPR